MGLGWQAIPIFEQDAFPASNRHVRHSSVHAMQFVPGGRNTFPSGSGVETAAGGFAGFTGRSAADATAQGSHKVKVSEAETSFIRSYSARSLLQIIST